MTLAIGTALVAAALLVAVALLVGAVVLLAMALPAVRPAAERRPLPHTDLADTDLADTDLTDTDLPDIDLTDGAAVLNFGSAKVWHIGGADDPDPKGWLQAVTPSAVRRSGDTLWDIPAPCDEPRLTMLDGGGETTTSEASNPLRLVDRDPHAYFELTNLMDWAQHRDELPDDQR